jgi:hypothetical protein
LHADARVELRRLELWGPSWNEFVVWSMRHANELRSVVLVRESRNVRAVGALDDAFRDRADLLNVFTRGADPGCRTSEDLPAPVVDFRAVSGVKWTMLDRPLCHSPPSWSHQSSG